MHPMRRFARVAVVAAFTALVLAPATASALQPTASPPNLQRLSDEQTLTRWAYPGLRAPVYSRPTGSARTVYRLHWLTEDRLPELYLVLAEWTDEHGARWAQIRLPGRPNGRIGWVRRSALREYNTVTTRLEIDKSKLLATLYRAGQPIWQAHVGLGAPSTPTPSGHFWIREKFRVIGTPVYGPYALGTSAYAPHLTDWPGGGVVGLHGTDAPGLIPGRPSHGCIRVRNEQVARLYRLTPRGTPVWIHS
jgi:hypothetical protein